MKHKLSLAGFLATILVISFGIGQLTSQHINTWYIHLHQPAITPPNWVFAPVWSLLYILIAISGWRVATKAGYNNFAMRVYYIQLLLNFAWSIIFFVAQNIGLAFIAIIALDALVLINIVVFNKIDKPASRLLIPYLLWILFATILNGSFFYLN